MIEWRPLRCRYAAAADDAFAARQRVDAMPRAARCAAMPCREGAILSAFDGALVAKNNDARMAARHTLQPRFRYKSAMFMLC